MANKKYYMQSKSGEVFVTSHPEYHEDCEQLSTTKGVDARREYCIKKLREMMKPGQKVYCMLRSVSRSGMSRVISLYIVHKGELRNIDAYASDVLLWGEADGGGIKVGGCGMDMGFHTVYTLGRYMFRDGFGIEGENPEGLKVTPKTKRQAESMVERGVKFRGRNGDSTGWDNDGGYALQREWM